MYPKSDLYRRMVGAKLFIDHNFAARIEISQMAEEAFVSKFHFIRLFRQMYGKTPHQYLTALRIEKARQLFKKDGSVSEVCFSVGFESPGSFSTLFKRYVGMSPSSFLAQEQCRKQQILQTPLHCMPGCFAYQHGWL